MRFVWSLLWAAVVVAAVWTDGKDTDYQDENEADDNRMEDPSSSARITTPPSLWRPADCADLLLAGTTTSGVYQIYPFSCSSCSNPVMVWCDMETDGGGWTVFLSRQEASPQLDFNRTWDEYKHGFGNLSEEHYLGNDMLHVMTQSRAYTIRLNLEHVTGGMTFATYETFRVNDENNRYHALLSGQVLGNSPTTYCIRYMNGRYFTTFDRDNDYYSGNCAASEGGGWWYYNCRPYFNPTTDGFNMSMELSCYTSYKFQVTKLQLMIRPEICDAPYKTIHLNEQGCSCQVLGR